MGHIFQLVYISKAVDDISYTDIEDILKVSRANNARDAITGLLIFRDGYFLQLLEGQEELVRATVAKIIEDDRNYKVFVMLETTGSSRLFEDWSMAFYDGDLSHHETPPLLDLFSIAFDKKKLERQRILETIKLFKASAPTFK